MDLLPYRDFFTDLFSFLDLREYQKLMKVCKLLRKIGKDNLHRRAFKNYPTRNGLIIKRLSKILNGIGYLNNFIINFGYSSRTRKLWKIDSQLKLDGIHFRYKAKTNGVYRSFYLQTVGWYKRGVPEYVFFVNVKEKYRKRDGIFYLRRQGSKNKFNEHGKLRNPYLFEIDDFASKVIEDPLIQLFLPKEHIDQLYSDIISCSD